MKSGLIYAIIPARAGSKGVPKKNVKMLRGYPLIAYSIAAAKLTKKIDRVIVSTESSEISKIAVKFGAEVPFQRPLEYAQDISPDLDFIRHAMTWFETYEKEQPDLLVHLRPTTPLRDPALIDEAIGSLIRREKATALRSVHELSDPPQKMMGINNGYLRGLFPHETRPEYYNLPRQSFPKAYHPNGYVDILKTDHINRHNTLHGPRILGFLTPFSIEVDNANDFEYLEYIVNKQSHPLYEYLTQKY